MRSDEELAEMRHGIRERIFQMLNDLDIDTNTARMAVDVVMDVASEFRPDAASQLSKDWNDWTFAECAAAALEAGER